MSRNPSAVLKGSSSNVKAAAKAKNLDVLLKFQEKAKTKLIKELTKVDREIAKLEDKIAKVAEAKVEAEVPAVEENPQPDTTALPVTEEDAQQNATA